MLIKAVLVLYYLQISFSVAQVYNVKYPQQSQGKC